MRVRTQGRAGRTGFTLPEILVVLAIAAVLMTLSAAAIYKFTNAQARGNTRTLLQRLDSRLRQQTAYVADQARKQTPPGAVMNLAGGDSERAKVIWQKLVLKEWFPVSFAEVFNPGPGYLRPKAAYVTYLKQYGINSGSSTPAAHESSACLYMALRHGPETAGEDDLSTGGAVSTIGGIPCYVDSWGSPLVFCRWPTGNSANGVSPVSPNGYANGFHDPADPRGMLTAAGWLGSGQRNQFQGVCHHVPDRTSGGQGQSLRLFPVIVSSGRDRNLGLNPQTLQETNAAQAQDNVYSIDVQ